MPTSSAWTGLPHIRGSTEATRMLLLTFSLIGISFSWSIEMTFMTPFLLQLGLSKSKTSFVWVAGPLSGLLMQPITGVYADRSTSRYGRRRPVMITCSALVGGCLILLGWVKETVGLFLSDETSKKKASIVLAVLTIYMLDFAINAVQACCRSLIVDTLPVAQQQSGAAWASRMGSSGNTVSHLIGAADLVAWLPRWLGGDTQFKKMCIISTVGLWGSVGLTCWAVTEKRLLAPAFDETQASALSILLTLWHRTIHLPPRIQAICWAQFCGWIGWFPFLFYSSTWVGETYYRYEHPPSTLDSPNNHDALGNIGRLGSRALVIFSFITFGSSILLPYLIKSAADPTGHAEESTPRPPASLPDALKTVLSYLPSSKPSLLTGWLISNLTFTAIFIWAPFVRSLHAATMLVALAGIPWAVTCWAPFAEMGVEINRLSSSSDPSSVLSINSAGYTAVRLSMEDEAEIDPGSHHRIPLNSATTLHVPRPDDGAPSSTGELAGVYLGVLNVYMTIPQLIGTFISWIVFSLLEPSKNDSVPGNDEKSPDHHSNWLNLKGANAIAVCLFIGACCSIIGAEACRRLKKIS